MSKHHLIVTIFLLALISIMCLVFGVSYSYILSGSTTGEVQSVNTGNLNANITYDSIQNKLSASSDDLNNYSTVTIEKDSNYSVYYELDLKYASTINSNEINSILPLENIEVSLYEINNGKIDDNPIIGPVRITDLPIVKYNDNILSAEYQLYIGKFSAGKDNKKYALKFNLTSDISSEENNKRIDLDLVVNQEPYRSKNIYNLYFNYTEDMSIILNGQQAVLEDGYYKLTNIPEGIYTLQVKKDNSIYETTLSIKGANDFIIQEYPIVSEYNSIQECAYKNKTTVYQIMKLNPSVANSNLMINNALESIPTSYEITAKQSLDIQDLKELTIKLNDNNVIITNDVSSQDANIGKEV